MIIDFPVKQKKWTKNKQKLTLMKNSESKNLSNNLI